MAKTQGISRYVCDRCGKTSYYAQAQQATGWMEVGRYTADRVQTSTLLCAECYEAYKPIAAQQDTAFNEFMAARAMGEE